VSPFDFFHVLFKLNAVLIQLEVRIGQLFSIFLEVALEYVLARLELAVFANCLLTEFSAIALEILLQIMDL
jgi:hypothetical protein